MDGKPHHSRNQGPKLFDPALHQPPRPNLKAVLAKEPKTQNYLWVFTIKLKFDIKLHYNHGFKYN